MKDNKNLDLSRIPLELRLLLSCLRASTGSGAEKDIGILSRSPIDWEAFIGLVDRHRVPAPAYRSLNGFGGNSIPEAILIRLRKRFQGNARQVLAKTVELVRIVNRFEHKDISTLVLKGPVLALQIYGDLASRHVGDLDIMVPLGRVMEAERLLLQEGYRRTYPGFDLTPRQQSAYMRNNQHFEYFCQERRIKVELHWRFGPSRHLFPLTFHDSWRDRQSVPVGGAHIATLSPEHTILFLCIHGAMHAWFRLFWLNDVAVLLREYNSIDWSILMKDAARLGVGRMVTEGIILSSLLLALPLPGPVRVFAGPGNGLHGLVRMALHLIKYPGRPPYRPFVPPYFYSRMHESRLRSDARYKLDFWLSTLAADDKDWEIVSLPDAFFPLYFILKPFTWFSRWYVRGTKVYKEGPNGPGKKLL